MNASNASAGRIGSLDGLRAVAILGVLWGHCVGTRGFPFGVFPFLGDVGNLGVRIFFVISGFLITHLLLKEWHSTGHISLKSFYLRRTFRIFPAFYVFIGCLILLASIGLVALRPVDALSAATYTINYVAHPGQKSWVVGHIWSLAVEEQFYLLWPGVLVAVGWKWGRYAALGAVALAPAFRLAVWYLLPDLQPLINKAFPTVCDTIATGCLLACFREELWRNGFYRALLESRAFFLAPLLVVLSNYLASHTRPDLLLGQTVRNLSIAVCIDWCMRNPVSLPGRFLNGKAMVWIGKLSYSLYLWQQVFLNRNSSAFYCAFPWNLPLAFLVGCLSYYFVEQPCLRLRARLFSSERPAAEPRVAVLQS